MQQTFLTGKVQFKAAKSQLFSECSQALQPSLICVLISKNYPPPHPPTPKRFEDGTVAFLDIIAINHAFDALYRITGAITDVVIHM